MHLRAFAPIFVFFVAACARGAPAPALRGGAAAAVSSDASVAVLVPADVARGDASVEGPVGFADLSRPSVAAVKANDEGVAALAKGSLPHAVERLRAAVGLAPGFVLARYNLACALARSGDHPAAAVELAAVFAIDWVGLRAQAARDGDLASFRESAEGRALLARDAEREARYRPAIERGVRALFWTARVAGATSPESLRIGVWDAVAERFVAVSERRRGEYGAFVASDLSYAVLATGRDLEPGGDMGDHVRVKDVTFWSWDTRGVPLATLTPDAGALGAHVYFRGEDATLSLSRGAPFEANPHSDKYAARATFTPAAGASKLVLLSHAANVIPPSDPARGIL